MFPFLNRHLLKKMMESEPKEFDIVNNGVRITGLYSSSTVSVDEPIDAVNFVESMHPDQLGDDVRFVAGTIPAVAAPVEPQGREMRARLFAVVGSNDTDIIAATGTGVFDQVIPQLIVNKAGIKQELESMRRMLQLSQQQRMLKRIGITADFVIDAQTSEATRRRLITSVLASVNRRHPYVLRYIDVGSLIVRFSNRVPRVEADLIEEDVALICPDASSIHGFGPLADDIFHDKIMWLWWD